MKRRVRENRDEHDDREGWQAPQPIVSVAECATYAPAVVRREVAAVLAPLGSLRAFVRPGMRVLIKPNLLLAADPDRAVTTHPAVIQVQKDRRLQPQLASPGQHGVVADPTIALDMVHSQDVSTAGAHSGAIGAIVPHVAAVKGRHRCKTIQGATRVRSAVVLHNTVVNPGV